MKPFVILKQIDPNGCIPACAISVLKHLEIAVNCSEAELLNQMKVSPGRTGFDQLKYSLLAYPEIQNWDINIQGRPVDLRDFLLASSSNEAPILFSESFPGWAHCFVITQTNEYGALVFDPAPSRPDADWYCYEKLNACWAGDALWFSKKD